MLIAHSTETLTEQLEKLRACTRDSQLAMIVTHGDLHDGHGTLINAARFMSDKVVGVILPNGNTPQPGSDNVVSASEFQDIGYAEHHHVDLLFVPQRSEIASSVSFVSPFDCPIAAETDRITCYVKLINRINPDVVLFGSANYLDYRFLEVLVRELDMAVRLHLVPTIRHEDGILVGSPAEQFSTTDRKSVTTIYRTLNDAAKAIESGARQYNKVANTARMALKTSQLEDVDFFILDDESLATADEKTTQFRLICNARLGGHVFSDNLEFAL